MILIPTHFYDFLFYLSAESGGIIAIESSGEYSMEFNSKGMFRAVCKWWYTTTLFVKRISSNWIYRMWENLKLFDTVDFLFFHFFFFLLFFISLLLVSVGDSFGKCSVGIWDDMIPFYVTPQGRASIIVTGYSEKIDLTESLKSPKSPNVNIVKVLEALDRQ